MITGVEVLQNFLKALFEGNQSVTISCYAEQGVHAHTQTADGNRGFLQQLIYLLIKVLVFRELKC
jgi:hypothetical protein